MRLPLPIHGRGAAANPPNRFQTLDLQLDGDLLDAEEMPAPHTLFLSDNSRSILARNDSPDVPFTFSINPYRGCEHGCIYCYARPTHEYLSLSAGLDFETKILVKQEAPELLRKQLQSPTWKPQVLSMSGVTDCYQPVERRLKLTRRCLEVLAEIRNPVGIVTKSHLVTRDIDILREMAAHETAAVMISITTLDADLAAKMEPRTSSPRRRLEAVAMLAEAGVPVGVMAAPVIPALTDHELPAILAAAAGAGARFAGYVPVRLPYAVAPLFEQWLADHYPDRREKVLSRIRALRDGKLNDASFGSRMRGQGIFADQIKAIFEMGKRKTGIEGRFPELRTDGFRSPIDKQGLLF